MPKIRTAAGAVALALVAIALSPLSAQAAPAPVDTVSVNGAQATSTVAVIRGAHFSPDTSGVDVYLTAFSGGRSALWLSDVGYGDVSPYRQVKPGFYAVSMRAHGAAASTPAALSWTVDAKAGSAYTVAAVGMNKNLKGIVLTDQLDAPAAGHGLVRVIQAASRAAHAEVVAQPHTVVAADAAFPSTTGYASVPAGTWTVRATSSSLATTAALHIGAGSVTSVVLLDGQNGGLELRSVLDATGSALTPTGSIDAGGGGMAPNRPATGRDTGGSGRLTVLVGVGAAGLLGLAVVGSTTTRRRRRVTVSS